SSFKTFKQQIVAYSKKASRIFAISNIISSAHK
ncbi:hypothetical protein Leryth_016983, partial [Lithospermum erythrorhizon]